MNDPRQPPDEQLLPRAMEGDRDAWNVLIARHERRVVLLLLSRGIRLDRARDIAQETWTRLFTHQQAGRLQRLELPGLAFKQAIFLSTDDARRSKRDLSLQIPHDEREIAFLSDPAASVEARLIARSELQRASAELDACPSQAQRVFELVYDDPALPHAETARRVGLSVQRVRQTICEVRARLRAVLEDDHSPTAIARSPSAEDSDE